MPLYGRVPYFLGDIVKIDNSYKTSIPAGAAPPSRKPAASPAPNGSAEVRLSSTAAQLAGADSSPPVDAGRIAEIKQAIAEGRFKINADAIADSLIATARELVDSRRQA